MSSPPESAEPNLAEPNLADVMLTLCHEAGLTRTIDPIEVAKRFAEVAGKSGRAWQVLLPRVRHTAVALAHEGRIVIYRKGVPADPDSFRGVYRLGAPNIT